MSTTKVASKKTGIAVGLNKGFIVTRREQAVRPSTTRGKLSNRVKTIRGVIREVAGWAPYEKRIMEILKGGGNNPQKRAQRFAKNRLGTHGRAKRKVAEMTEQIAVAARQAAAQKAAAAKKAESK